MIERKQQPLPRSAGVLLPVFSLPSPYGIGTLGKDAYAFVDFLKAAGQTWWQVLPLGPTSYGDSPYQSFSAFAGNPYFIDLEMLAEQGLLTLTELAAYAEGLRERPIDYARLYTRRLPLLRTAFARSHHDDTLAYHTFCRDMRLYPIGRMHCVAVSRRRWHRFSSR